MATRLVGRLRLDAGNSPPHLRLRRTLSVVEFPASRFWPGRQARPARWRGNTGLVRILVTNDDGIDSEGLHVLARAMSAYGSVTVVAPDDEYSGASAALGALHRIHPEVHRVHLDDLPTPGP